MGIRELLIKIDKVQLLLIAVAFAFVILIVFGLTAWIGFLSGLRPEHWELALCAVAAFLNMLLCATAMVVGLSLQDFGKDHMNHFDVERAIFRTVLPEQMLQISLTVVLGLNKHWLAFGLQAPLAAWHLFCLVTRRQPVQAVIGRGDKFEEQLTVLKQTTWAKAVFYIFTMIHSIYQLIPLAARALLRSDFMQSMFRQVHNNFQRLGSKALSLPAPSLKCGPGTVAWSAICVTNCNCIFRPFSTHGVRKVLDDKKRQKLRSDIQDAQ
mmetsp:Transcript_18784/g.29313  ORF Transcript_18784/g.29313 Transcript_18784/m.29313 type:complete len:267 (-) Transcript_18784:1791-2591(-)